MAAPLNQQALREKIEPLLTELLRLAGLRITFEVQDTTGVYDREFENPDAVVNLTGPDADLLLENRAELLLAIEHVVLESIRLPLEDRGRLVFDCHEYRMMRVDELRLAAHAAADNVRRTGVPYKFNPMNSRERRVVHMALRGESGVRSESEGFGPHRHVVIQPTHPAHSGNRPRAHRPSR